MKLVTAAPFCEMVWSQERGLSVKYSYSSLVEKKASVLWCNESFNIGASKHCSHQGETSHAKDLCYHGEIQQFSDINDATAKGVPEMDEDCDGKELDICLTYTNGCQLNASNTETDFIQEQDLNHESARIEAFKQKPLCIHSQEFTTKYNDDSPCLDLVPSTQDDVLAKDKKEMKLPHRNWFGIFSCTQNSDSDVSMISKCKEPIICHADDNRSTSNRREDVHDHVGFFSSREMGATVKRTRSYEFELEKLAIGKRLKKYKSGGWSTSLTQGSSFMNWVAAITNGLIGSSQVKPLELLQHERGGSFLYEEKVDVSFAHESNGFKSIFQAMYSNGSNTRGSKVQYIGKKAELPALKGPFKTEKGDDVSSCVHREMLDFYHKLRSASCSCVKCFQEDHWAAACLNFSSKRKFSNNALAFNDGKFKGTMDKNHQSHSFTNDEQRGHQFNHETSVPQRESEAENAELMVCSKLNCYKNVSAGSCRSDIHVNGVEDTTSVAKTKDTVRCFLKNKLFDYPPSCMPKGIFVAVRKLRLSRTDIIRWMKSSTQHFNIGGFFLRLRLGKLKKGLGSTSYHVACINGSSSQNSISVCVGSSTYSVNSTFISNHDFHEHELKAWWLGRLRNGAAMLSKEELDDKVQLRLKLGF